MLGTPLPLEHLSLVMLDIDVPIASDLLASMEVIHLIESQQDEILGDFPGKAYQSAYRRLDKHLKKISPYLDRRVVVERRAAPVALDELDRADKRAQSLWKRVSSYEEKIRAAREKIQHHKQLSNSLTQFENLDFDLGWLSADNPFLKFLVGTVPHAELSQLERALSLANTVIEPFQKSQEHDYIFVATEKEHQQDTEEIL